MNEKSSKFKNIEIPLKIDDLSLSPFNWLNFWDKRKMNNLQDPTWQKNNMEYDLLMCESIISQVRESDRYAQNLYAAMCNNEFVKCDDTWNILKENYWSVSWRYAGGIIADMREQGDYIDWYCSGSFKRYKNGYVAESVVTNDIKEDLRKIGWEIIKQTSYTI